MTAAAQPQAMPLGRAIAAYFSEARYESLRLLRTPAFSIPILAMPVLMYLFFGVLLGGRGGPGTANWLFVGWTVFAVMGPGLFGFGVLVAVERTQGILVLKRALPMPPGVYLSAKLIMALAFAAMVMVLLIAVGLLVGHVSLPPLTLLTVAGVMSLGVIPACAVGLFIGAYAPASSAAAIANIVYLAMAFLSGLFFPLPAALQVFRPIWPTYHLAQLALASGGLPSHGSLLGHVAILAVISVVLTTLAARRLA
ncbi:MAG: ABC transporter permease, partial [Phenylobacterium sp.]